MLSSWGERPVRIVRHLAFMVIAILAILLLVVPSFSSLCYGSDDQSADDVLHRYGLPGERAVTCYPVKLDGREYDTYCFTKPGTSDEENLTKGWFMLLTPEQWTQDGIGGVVVVRKGDNSPEVDPLTLFKVFNTLRFGYSCYYEEMSDACQDPGEIIKVVKRLNESADSLGRDLWQPPLIQDKVRERYKVSLTDALSNPALLLSEATRENGEIPVDQQKWIEEIAGGSTSVAQVIDYLEKLALNTGDVMVKYRLQEERACLEKLLEAGENGDDVTLMGEMELDRKQSGNVLGAALLVLDPISIINEERLSMQAALDAEGDIKKLYGNKLEGAMSDARKGMEAEKDLLNRFGDFLLDLKDEDLDGEPDRLAGSFCDLLLEDDLKLPGAVIQSSLTANSVVDGTISDSIYETYTQVWGKNKIARAAMTDVIYCYRIVQAMEKAMESIALKTRPTPAEGYDYEAVNLFRSCYLLKNLALATCYTSLATILEKRELFNSLSSRSRDLIDLELGDHGRAEEASRIGVEGSSRLINEILYTPTMNRAISQAVGRGMGTVESLCTILIMDSSGSMGNYVGNVQKMDAAKAAANQVIGLIRRYAEQQDKTGVPSTDSMALITFSKQAKVISGVTQDFNALENAVGELEPQDYTNMGAGIEEAIKLLEAVPEKTGKSIVVLSDGKNNQGMTNEEILSNLVPRVNDLDSKIYTVGFGEEKKDLDEEFLKKLAGDTGGEYFYAGDSWELANAYINVRLSSLGKTKDWSGEITQGQEADLGTVTVPSRTGELHAVLNWPETPGSILRLRVTDPEGKVVGPDDYPSATIFADAKPLYVVVNKPVEGEWKFEVLGEAIPEGNMSYYVAVDTRALPKAGETKKKSNKKLLIILIIGGIILLGGVITALILLSRRSRARGEGVEAPVTTVCPACGNELEEGWSRCPYCSWQEEEATSAPPTVTPSAQPAPPGSPQVIPPVPVGAAYAPGEGAWGVQEQTYGPQAGTAETVCHLDILEGEGAGGYYVIDTPLVTIGRDPDNHIVLEDQLASGRHARLYWLEGGFFIEDLDSTNGTLVEGEPIVTAWLVDGSRITIGDTKYELRMPDS